MDMSADTARYDVEIRVRGVLSDRLLAAFPGLHAEPILGGTVLSGVLADQSALYGVLDRVEALGLELVDLRCGLSGREPAASARE